MRSKFRSNFNENLPDLHNKYVIVAAEKASNNLVLVCKIECIDCLVREVGINTGNPTYTPISPLFHLTVYRLR